MKQKAKSFAIGTAKVLGVALVAAGIVIAGEKTGATNSILGYFKKS